MRTSQPNRNIYTAYRGDTYLGEGTIDEIAVLAGVKRSTVQWCTRRTAAKRIEARERAWREGRRKMPSKGSLILIKVDDEEE